MKKTIVCQSMIGSGSLTWDVKNTIEINNNNSKILEKCVESVREWCANMNFEYQFATHDLGWNFKFKSKNDKQLNRCLQNWHYLPKAGFDRVIYLDNDVFILNKKVDPPYCKFGMVERLGDQVSFAKYYYGNTAKWWNAGVIIMDQKTCSDLSKWMLEKIALKSRSYLFKDLPREESLLTEYCAFNQPMKLDPRWNTMPPQSPKPVYRTAKFLHLLGPDKLKILRMCPEYIQNKVFPEITNLGKEVMRKRA